ncbi:MaoC/PaaZ C-terminal domain-containing protein [Nocardia neocaledoniensis]|uniref:MaoC/PaaZ C-terminal domain-containing protein n=1 Tax=Nocardia neocaledoniensis TaxID=236511 RepID=UPI0024557F23|nr:MaoC/PaaZ C-terminal domain-containing protein [Nocardia neocaledoniensis]
MSIDLTAVGRQAEPFVVSWSETDAILYALGVGAGQANPAAELAFTTENSKGITQQVLPAFAIPLLQTGIGRRIPFGDYPRGALVHAEQAIVAHRPIPASGSMRISARITGIYDKRSGALVRMEAVGEDAGTGEHLVTTRLGYFVRGYGGFDGPATPTETWEAPDREPDLTVTTETRADQALLYRLSGDRNPLHSDPEFATAAGFDRPILHGLCTYGVVARELVRVVCDGDPTLLDAMSARFSKPVFPGDTLTTAVWIQNHTALFRTTTARGVFVLDQGVLTRKRVPVARPEPVFADEAKNKEHS